jgi:peptidase E
MVVFLREGGWISKKNFAYKNRRTQNLEENWLKKYKKNKIFVPRVHHTAKKKFFSKQGGDILAQNLMETLNLRRITEVNTPNNVSVKADEEAQLSNV